MAEARNSTVIKGSLALCSHSLEVRTGINQIIKDDGSEGKELSAGRRVMAREQVRERGGRNRCRKPSRAKHAVAVMEGEEAPASTGERKGCMGRVCERTGVSPEMSTDCCLSYCCEPYGLAMRSRSETAFFFLSSDSTL